MSFFKVSSSVEYGFVKVARLKLAFSKKAQNPTRSIGMPEKSSNEPSEHCEIFRFRIYLIASSVKLDSPLTKSCTLTFFAGIPDSMSIISALNGPRAVPV